MTKFCSNCGGEIDKNADVCIHCGKDLNVVESKKKSKLIIVLVTVVILLSIISMIAMFVGFIYLIDKEIVDNPDIDVEDLFDTDWATIGETINYKNLNIKLENAFIYDYLGEGASAEVPSENNEYLIFFFEVENLRPTSYNININNFIGYVDGKQVNITNLVSTPDGYSPFNGIIDIGMKRKGYVAFEVNKNWSNFELNYQEVGDDDKFTFKILSDDDTSGTGVEF